MASEWTSSERSDFRLLQTAVLGWRRLSSSDESWSSTVLRMELVISFWRREKICEFCFPSL